MMDERELIRRAGQGDQEAFRQLVETYQAPAYRLALRMCGGDAALSDEHRQVLLLRYMQELDYGEIAVALGISEGTVKSRINRAKARLKELLSGGGNLSAVISVKTAGEEGQK